jgi:GNAT superfamily N-acetyltransferase
MTSSEPSGGAAESPPEPSAASAPDFTELDNPIWYALLTGHAHLAQGGGLARRYPAAIGPLSGMPSQSPASYAALRGLAGPGGVVVLFLREPPAPPSGWTLVLGGHVDQMVCLSPADSEPEYSIADRAIERLTASDVPAMIELARLTEPGPFKERTIELGEFSGIFGGGRLLAMAGQRMHFDRIVEVSAVCTHPEARGRGYARALTARVAKQVRQMGKIPILHVFAHNRAAIRVYESLGFARRRTFELAVLKSDG